MAIKFTTKDEQIDALITYIDELAKSQYEYETEHEDAASNYLMLLEPHCLTEFMRREKYDHYNDELRAVIKDALAADISQKAVWEAICETVEVRPGSMFCQNNTIECFPVGEIEAQLSGMSGTVNGKEVNCVFSALTAGLTPDELEKASRRLSDAYWDSKRDYIYINTDHHWHMHVEPAELREKLGLCKESA